MKKFFLILFILFDALVIVASVTFLLNRWKIDKNLTPMTAVTPMTPLPTTGVTPTPMASSSTVTTSSGTPAVPTAAAAPTGSGRKILFAYKNSKAKNVKIRADFTGWRGEPMQKDAAGKWTYMAVLEPGEYAYCFSVDDKSIRDPANKRVKQVGKTRVSSIVVQSPAAAPH